jgi:hypothetical protein
MKRNFRPNYKGNKNPNLSLSLSLSLSLCTFFHSRYQMAPLSEAYGERKLSQGRFRFAKNLKNKKN